MIKNTAIILLIIACLVEGVYIAKTHHSQEEAKVGTTQAKLPSSSRPKPMFLMKGQKFADNPLSQKAYLIFPVTSDLSPDAKTALTGWKVKTTPNDDGSTTVAFIPSEAEDIQQSFTVRPGYKLYFIELTMLDDNSGVDENRGDDIGVLVDSNGIVQ